MEHIASACLIDVAGILNQDSCLRQGKDDASIIVDQDQESPAHAGDASSTTEPLAGFYDGGDRDQKDMPPISEMESPLPESTFDAATEFHGSSSTSLSSMPSDRDQREPGPSGTKSRGKAKAKARAYDVSFLVSPF